MERKLINEDALDQIVGGVFQFYKGGTRCKVQGGKYKCDSDGQFRIIDLMNANPDLSEAELLDLAIDEGILEPI